MDHQPYRTAPLVLLLAAAAAPVGASPPPFISTLRLSPRSHATRALTSHSRPSFLTALAAAWLSLFAAGAAAPAAAGAAGSGSNPPPSTAAIQAWVFDGAYQLSALHGLALTASGMVAHADSPLECPGSSSFASPGFFALGPAQVGVFVPVGPEIGFGPALDPSFPAPAPPPPIDPALVEDDCVALANEGGVQSYVSNLTGQADAVAAQVEACVADVRQAACDIFVLLEQWRLICQTQPERCPVCITTSGTEDFVCSPFDTSDPALPALDWGTACLECGSALQTLPAAVGLAAGTHATCQLHENRLVALRSDLQAFVAGSLPTLSFCPCSVEEAILARVDQAESTRKRLEDILQIVDVLATSCSHESLVASCDDCPANPGELPLVLPSGAVNVRLSARHLSRLAAKFQSASSSTTDPELSATYAGLANRLADLTDELVLEVTAPADSPFTQQFVAVRRPDGPDGPESPLAVVLTLVRNEGPPRLNSADLELLDRALAAFKDTLAPRGTCSTCDPPR